jgi:hypothetical protein
VIVQARFAPAQTARVTTQDYFQTRLEDLFPARSSLRGTLVSWPALVIQAALFAVLAMWTLLTAPDRVASAAPDGLPALFQVVLAVVFEAARPLVAWL